MNDRSGGSKGYIEIEPLDTINNVVYPTHGTVFTARMPHSVSGGINSAVKLLSYAGVFRGYEGTLQRRTTEEIEFLGKELLRSLRPEQLYRFIVDDRSLKTNHDIRDRKWFNAILLRPVFMQATNLRLPGLDELIVSEHDRPQAVIDPTDFSVVLEHISSNNADMLNAAHPVIQNDIAWLKYREKVLGHLPSI